MTTLAFSLFVQHAFEPGGQFYFAAVVFTVVVSITLHELAHGWLAIRLGDRTPIWTNRMTGNPLVHMGPFSIAALLIAGLAWGQMPIDPTRMRGRYAEALVAAAGPATNLLLGLAALIALGLLWRVDALPEAPWADNLVNLLNIFGVTNLLLCVFNLLPVPPLDGSAILANLHRPYRDLVGDPSKQGLMILGFVAAFMFAGYLHEPIAEVSGRLVFWIATVGVL